MMPTTSTTSYSSKLLPPAKLPEEGLTALQFKPWKSLMETFLQQFKYNVVFFPCPRTVALNHLKEGIYSTWKPSGQCGIYGRIDKLHDSDKCKETDLRAIQLGTERGSYIPTQYTALGVKVVNTGMWIDEGAEGQKAAILKDLDEEKLFDRNRDLSVLLAHITNACSINVNDDITHRSISLESIWAYLQNHYNIAPKGANFLRIASITYKSDEQYYSFYKRLRASFIDNLRKAGARDDSRWTNERLDKDERLTPSHEDTIILIALKEIDPRLPDKVRRVYEHQLNQDNYLSDIHPQIFQAIPIMLQELDGAAQAASIQATLASLALPSQANQQLGTNQGVELQAFNMRGGGRGRGGGRRPFGRGGGSAGGRGRQGQDDTWYPIYCSICKRNGKPASVFSAHWTSECKSLAGLSLEDKSELVQGVLASMTLGDYDFDFQGEQELARSYPNAAEDPLLNGKDQTGGAQLPQGPPTASS